MCFETRPNAKPKNVIQQAINDYYKKYDRDLKKRIRKVEKRNFSVSFATSQINHIRKRAKEYNLTIPDYLKLLVSADLCKSSPLEQVVMFKEILQLLNTTKQSIQNIEDKDVKNWLGQTKNYEVLTHVITQLEQDIRSLLKHVP